VLEKAKEKLRDKLYHGSFKGKIIIIKMEKIILLIYITININDFLYAYMIYIYEQKFKFIYIHVVVGTACR